MSNDTSWVIDSSLGVVRSNSYCLAGGVLVFLGALARGFVIELRHGPMVGNLGMWLLFIITKVIAMIERQDNTSCLVNSNSEFESACRGIEGGGCQ